jgi:phosphoribosyl-ATP pyrophosphohydrolase/phosphoribosyl-AMP cyclohydrolase
MDEVKFNNDGLIPAIIQDYENGQVLMLGYMNREALEKSLETGITHYWSRSRKKIWMKGETSGHIQQIEEIAVDCDGDALLVRVKQVKAACHNGYRSCFYRIVSDNDGVLKVDQEKLFDPEDVYSNTGQNLKNRDIINNIGAILQELYDVIDSRKRYPKEGSYTCYLFEEGIDKILKKVGEESSEVIIAAKNRDKGEVVYEVSDLLYHILVLLVEQGISLGDIHDELRKRR